MCVVVRVLALCARACEVMRGHARACEGLGGFVRVYEGMRGHLRTCGTLTLSFLEKSMANIDTFSVNDIQFSSAFLIGISCFFLNIRFNYNGHIEFIFSAILRRFLVLVFIN